MPTAEPPKGPLAPGTPAPEFTLPAGPDKKLSLSDYRGKLVVLAFYPADWSPVCTDQMSVFNEAMEEFQRLGADVLGVSVDGIWCHKAFASDRKYRFPLLSDFEPKGATASAYGVYRPRDGISERALFVIDDQGVIRWNFVSPIAENPGVDGVLRALESVRK